MTDASKTRFQDDICDPGRLRYGLDPYTGHDMPRLGALRPYSLLLLVPLWMAGGMAMHSGYRLLGLVAMTVMLVVVLDSATDDVRRRWPFSRSVMLATGITTTMTVTMAASGYIPG